MVKKTAAGHTALTFDCCNDKIMVTKTNGGDIMLTAISGYYNGSYIVVEGNVALTKGQKVIITLDLPQSAEQKKVDLSGFMGRGEKMFTSDAADYVKELRKDDRI